MCIRDSLTTSIFAGFGVSSLLAGKLVDRVSFDRAFFLGHLTLGLFLLLGSFSVSYWQLFLFLFLSGFGDSLITTASAKAVVCWFPEEGRATVSAIYKTGFPLGSAIAAISLPLVALRFSWATALRIIGVIFIIWGGVVIKIYQRNIETQPEVTFVAEEQSQRSSLSSFSKWKVYLVGIAGMLFTVVQYCLVTYLVIYLVEERSFSFLLAASLLSIFQLSGIGAVSYTHLMHLPFLMAETLGLEEREIVKSGKNSFYLGKETKEVRSCLLYTSRCV